MEEIKFVLRCLSDVGLWRLSYQTWGLYISCTPLADDPPTFDDALTEEAEVPGVWITSKLKPTWGTKATCSYN